MRLGWRLLISIFVVWLWFVIFTLPDGDRLRVVFCDVGQGDALLVIRGSFQVIIDGGPEGRVLGCLAKFVPFWDREIEIVWLTHPQADHMDGLGEVIDRYRVGRFVLPEVNHVTGGFSRFMQKVKSEGVEVNHLYTGDTVMVGKDEALRFEVVWPERQWMLGHLDPESGLVKEGEDLNSFSQGVVVRFGEFELFSNGDADIQVERNLLGTGRLGDIDVMKVPHHGSKTAMTWDLGGKLKPELAVISVGKGNSYGHPSSETINMFEQRGIKVARTDELGDIVVESGGKGWILVRQKNKTF